MARIPDQIIEQVREAHDIVDVVGRSVELKRAGTGYKGLCPFHDEKTPSFTVHPGRQTFMCFGCHKGGNAITFVMSIQNLSFPEAVRQLAAERGIDVPEAGRNDPELDARLAAIRKALGVAHRYFVASLKGEQGYEARAYLEKRGYDAAAVEEFGLGYAPDSWDGLRDEAHRAGLSDRALLDAGLVRPRANSDGVYDYFRHRVIFPIADGRGRLVTFAGRALDPDDPAKYMNGPETDVFKKSAVLYRLHHAREAIRRAGEAVLMEGYTDVLMCHLHGFENAVAGMGTAFTDSQAQLLSRAADRLVLLYDADAAGQGAAQKALPILLGRGMDVRVASLPAGRDVDEILLEDGPEALTAILADAQGWFDFKLDVLGGEHDLGSPRGRAQASEALLALVGHVQSPIERDQFFHEIAERLGSGPTSERVLRKEAARQVETRRRRAATAAAAPPATVPSATVPASTAPGAEAAVGDFGGAAGGGPLSRPGRGGRLDDAMQGLRGQQQALEERDLLAAAIHFPDLRDAVFRSVGPEEFSAPDRARLYDALLGLSEEGQVIDFALVMTRFQADPEVAGLLAGLPEDTGLEERVDYMLRHVERRRAENQRLREVVRIASGGQDTGRPHAAPDPDDSYFGDDDVPEGDFDEPPPAGPRADTDDTEAF